MVREKNDIYRKIILFILFLTAMNIFQYGTYLVFLLFAAVVIVDRKMKIDQTGLLLLLFAITYVIFCGINGESYSNSLFRIVIFPLAYMIGLSLYKEATEKKIRNIILFIAVSMAMRPMVNFAYNLILEGEKAFKSGESVDIGTGVVSAATGQAAYYFFLIGTLAYVFFALKEKKLRFAMFVLYIVSLIHDIALGGRTFILLTVISLVVGLIYSLYSSKEKSPVYKAVLIIALLLFAVYVLFTFNVFGLRDFYESSYMYFRLYSIYSISFLETSRIDRKLVYISNMFKYPFGGNNIRRNLGVGYAHELWLDVFDDAGWIPYLLLCIYTLVSIFRWLRLAKGLKDRSIGVLVIGLLAVLLTAFFLEPILAGCPTVFAMYCIVDGVISSHLNYKKRAAATAGES